MTNGRRGCGVWVWGVGNMRTVRLRPVRLGLGEISTFMLSE